MTRALRALLPHSWQSQITRVLASPLGGRLARGAFWSLAGTAIARVFSTVSWVIVGRLLGKEGFGELGMIQNTVGMFGTIAAFGMGMATTKYVAEFRHNDPARAGRFVALASVTNWITSGLLALVLVISAPWLAETTLKAPELTNPLRLSALMLFFSGIAGASTGALGGLEAYKVMARVNLIVGIVSFPLMVLGALWWGVNGAICGLIASTALNTFLFWWVFRAEATQAGIRVIYRGCWAEAKMFWDFNLPGMLNTLFSSLVLWAVGAILVRNAQGFGDLGLYNAVQRIRLIPENFTAMLLTPILPVLIDTFTRRDMKGYGKSLSLSFLVSGVVIVPIALMQLSVPFLTTIPYGEQFRSADHGVVIWVMLGTIAYSLSWPMGNILISMGRIWFACAIGVFSGVVNIGFAAWLIPTYGSTGLAIAAFAGFIAAFVPCLLLLFREFSEIMRRIRWLEMLCGTSLFAVISIYAGCVFEMRIAAFVGLFCSMAYLVWRLHPRNLKVAIG